jgi:hypothetical protein
MYLFCNSRIHVITLYSGHVCVYYASMLRCWHLIWILVMTDHPCLGVGCHIPISKGNREDSSQFKPYKDNNLTIRHMRARRAPRVVIVHNAIKEMIRVHLTLVHVFHAYASADTSWVAHPLSRCTHVRYGRIVSVSTTYEATQFVGPHKIMYVPIHNSNFLTGAKRSVLNRHRRRLPPWSSKF